MNIKLVLLDGDREYLNRISSVLSNKYSDNLEIYSFTELNLALHTLKTIKIDIFLANEEFNIDESVLPEKCGFAYIADDSEAAGIRGQRAIFKYQRIDLFYKEILGIYADNTSIITSFKKNSNKTAQIIIFMSANGGAGSSLLAAAFAKYAAANGKKALYLNLEQLGSADDFFKGEGRLDFSDVIYAVKSKKANLALKLESMVKQDSSGAYFYSSSGIALDLLELDEEDIRIIMQELSERGKYDYLIVDMNFSFDERNRCVMELGNKIILVENDTSVLNTKLRRLCDAVKALEAQDLLNISDKLFLVYNRSKDKNFRIAEVPDINCLGSVPDFEGDSKEAIVNQMMSEEWFKFLMNEQEMCHES